MMSPSLEPSVLLSVEQIVERFYSLPPSEDIQQYLETFIIVMTGGMGGLGATDMYWIEGKNAVKYPTVHETIPYCKE